MEREELLKLRDEFKLKERPAARRKAHAPAAGAKTPGEYFGFMEAFDVIIEYMDFKENKRYEQMIDKIVENLNR